MFTDDGHMEEQNKIMEKILQDMLEINDKYDYEEEESEYEQQPTPGQMRKA